MTTEMRRPTPEEALARVEKLLADWEADERRVWVYEERSEGISGADHTGMTRAEAVAKLEEFMIARERTPHYGERDGRITFWRKETAGAGGLWSNTLRVCAHDLREAMFGPPITPFQRGEE